MELGVSMFADLSQDEATGRKKTAHQRIQELMKEIQLSDEVGLDVFGIGEHHRNDYAVSSPEIILAAAASVTKNIKLGSAVTVLSSSDPVKVYQNFATIDLLSNGRAEIIVGRGSFIESFPLFGYDLKDYNELFVEKLDLLLQINNNPVVNWSGKFRAPLSNQEVFPRGLNDPLPIWIAVGGTPESVQRAARLGLPLMLAIIGGSPAQFGPLVDYYKAEYIKHGHDITKLQIGVHVHSFVGTEGTATANSLYPYYAAQMNRIGRDRGWSPYSRSQFDAGRGKNGALFVGDPAEVTDKILALQESFGLTRFVAHMDVGGAPHKEMMQSIELFGTQVAPAVRKALKG